MTRFALYGGGWRAEFFARIAKALPEQFELTGTYLRNPDKRPAWQAQFGGRMAASPEELLEDKPDFLILSVTRKATPDTLISLLDLNIPILCETTPANTLEEMHRLYALAKEKKALIQVAEQYMDWPMYDAWMKAVDEGLVGEVTNLSISAVHSYHAASVIRRFLKAGFGGVSMIGCHHEFPIRQTGGRAGLIQQGEIAPSGRDRLTLQFDNGKVAFFDFAGVQYHSFIRTRQFNLQGTQGEIDDMTIRRMGPEDLPLCQTLVRHDLNDSNNAPLGCMGLQLGDKWLWRNPYPVARLNDDEIAIAVLMDRMGALCRGESTAAAYSLEDGLQDAYYAVLMEQALANPWTMVKSDAMPWCK